MGVVRGFDWQVVAGEVKGLSCRGRGRVGKGGV